MSDSTTSGNRWEPTTDTETPEPPAWQPTPAGAATAVADRPAYDTQPEAAAPGRTLRDRVRAVPRGLLAAVAAALLVIAVALGGFAVGRATAPEVATTPTGVDGGGFQGRFDGDGDGGPQDFPGGGPGQGTRGAPGQGTGTGVGTAS